MTGSNTVTLRNSTMRFFRAQNLKGFTSVDFNGMRFMIVPTTLGSFSLNEIDLTGVRNAKLTAGWQKAPDFGYTIELRLDSPDGKKIGEGVVKSSGGAAAPGAMGGTQVVMKIEPVNDGKLHNVYIVSKPLNEKETGQVGLQQIEFMNK